MITILGATGNVGGKIADGLVQKGEKVRLIARSVEQLRQKVGKQANAMAGDMLDTEFLVRALQDSDAVFTLIPPNVKAGKYLDYAERIGSSIARALRIAGIRHVVNLSSVGADLPAGTGPLAALHCQEERLNALPGLNVLHLRAAYFMENTLMNIELIRSRGITGSALRGDLRIPMIATRDVAAFAAERLRRMDFSGSSVRYLLGKRDLSMVEATMLIGIRIGMPNLTYVSFPYQEAEKALIAAGVSPDMSRLYIEMSRAFNEGRISARRTQENTTQTSYEEFCDQVFVPVFLRQKAA